MKLSRRSLQLTLIRYPPELPIYNWIIQAFYPLVQMVAGSHEAGFLEPQQHEQVGETLTGSYRKLTHAAAVGWTTGLLRKSLGEDAGEYLVWQEQQQLSWQKLQTEWKHFIDRLCQELSDHASLIPHNRLPPNAVIVLPIDDLDLQVDRIRELLLAIRVLRHKRLVYILTGHSKGTDLALQASFYREFLDGIPTMAEEYQDQVREFTNTLAPQVRKKSIPESQTFEITGQNISEAMSWKPYDDGDDLGQLLDKFWKKHRETARLSNKRQNFSKFLKERHIYDEQNRLAFRSLQSFFDRWSGEADLSTSNGLHGIAEFLRIAISDPQEESLSASNPTPSDRIEISSYPGVYAPRPRPAGSVEGSTKQIEIKWAVQLDFVRRELGKGDKPEEIYQNASPGHLLALDLAVWENSTFELANDLRLTNRALGLVWTEISENGKFFVVPWPLKERPISPLEWVRQCNRFNEILNLYIPSSHRSSNPTEEELVMAWCVFISGKNVQISMPVQYHLEHTASDFARELKALGSEHLGLSTKLRETVRKSLGAGLDWDAEVQRYPVERTSLNHNMLAFVPTVEAPEINSLKAIENDRRFSK